MEIIKKTSSIKCIFIGIIISVITTIILLLLLSAVLTYTSIGENIIQPAIIVITGVSILLGSSVSNYKIKRRGILNGAIIGGTYLLTIYLLSSLINRVYCLNTASVITIVIGIGLGILGGIIGVNKK